MISAELIERTGVALGRDDPTGLCDIRMLSPRTMNTRHRRLVQPSHPQLVADELATMGVQDRRAPHPTCAVLHPPARRKPLDSAPLRADPRPHRATRVASDLIERTVHR